MAIKHVGGVNAGLFLINMIVCCKIMTGMGCTTGKLQGFYKKVKYN